MNVPMWKRDATYRALMAAGLSTDAAADLTSILYGPGTRPATPADYLRARQHHHASPSAFCDACPSEHWAEGS